jgi:hypothetical protein
MPRERLKRRSDIMPVNVKICGLSTPECVDAAIKGGASHIGLMFFPPSPRAVSFDRAAALSARIPPHVRKVGVFVEPCNALIDQALARAGQISDTSTVIILGLYSPLSYLPFASFILL